MFLSFPSQTLDLLNLEMFSNAYYQAQHDDQLVQPVQPQLDETAYANLVQKFVRTFGLVTESVSLFLKGVVAYHCLKFIFFSPQSTCSKTILLWMVFFGSTFVFLAFYSVVRIVSIIKRRETEIPKRLTETATNVNGVILFLYLFGVFFKMTNDHIYSCSKSFSAFDDTIDLVTILMLFPCCTCLFLCCYIPLIICCIGMPPNEACRPASEETIGKLQKGKWGEMVSDVNQCTICLEFFGRNSVVTVLPCSPQHLFHSDCVEPWLKMFHGTCPLCRRNVTEEILLQNGHELQPGALELQEARRQEALPPPNFNYPSI